MKNDHSNWKKIFQGLVVSALLTVKGGQLAEARATAPLSRERITAKAVVSKPTLDAVDYSSVRWNKGAQQYIGTDGKFISHADTRAVVDAEISGYNGRMVDAANSLQQRAQQAGALNPMSAAEWKASVEQWRDEMWRQMRLNHLANLAAGNGGFHTLDASDYGRAGGLLKKQREYLDQFASQLASDPALALSPQFAGRCQMYGEAGRGTYELQRRVAHKKAGFRWERNVLYDSATACSGCLAETAKGWVRIGKLVRIGMRPCMVKDRCSVEYARRKPKA